jgi:hypothetical protein
VIYLGEIFKSTKEQREKARQRIKSSERERGTDEEYYNEVLESMLNVMEKYKDMFLNLKSK